MTTTCELCGGTGLRGGAGEQSCSCGAIPPSSHLLGLLDQYWSIAYQQGMEGRSHDNEAGDAQRVLSEITAALALLPGEAVTDLPADIIESLLAIGYVEWGQTHKQNDGKHLDDLEDTLRLTRQHFGIEDKETAIHGLYLADTSIVLAHTGMSPNSPQHARILAGAWNQLVDIAKGRSALSSPVEGGREKEEKPLDLDITKEWFEKRAALEGDLEIGAGSRRLTQTIHLTPEEIAVLEKLVNPTAAALRAEIEALRVENDRLRDELNQRENAIIYRAAEDELRENWVSFCDADPFPNSDTFGDRMESHGLIELVPVTKSALEDALAAERGLEAGGMMYRLTVAGRAALQQQEEGK